MFGSCCGSENRNDLVRELGVDDVFHELAQQFGVKFVAGDLPLELPFFPVSNEDRGAKEIRDCLGMDEAFLLNRELGLEDVLYGGGVGGEGQSMPWGMEEGEGGGR